MKDCKGYQCKKSKRTFSLFLAIIMVLSFLALPAKKAYAGSSWKVIGTDGFTESNMYTYCSTVKVDSHGTPYVAYILDDGFSNNMILHVRKFDGTQWVEVGAAITEEKVWQISFAMYNDVPYVAYCNAYSDKGLIYGRELIVKKFNSSSNMWEKVGSTIAGIPGNTQGSIGCCPINFDLYVYNGVPYVAYGYYGVDKISYLNIKKFNNSNNTWEFVGSSNITRCDYKPCLFVENENSVYALILDNDYCIDSTGYRTTLYKYGGSSWNPLGGKGASNGCAVGYTFKSASLYVYNGVPYISYMDYDNTNPSNNYSLTVEKYDGSWKVLGNRELFDSDINECQVIVYNGTPYVAYSYDYAKNFSDYGAGVMQFNGSAWETLGGNYFKQNAFDVSMDIYQGIPYVCYINKADTGDPMRNTLSVQKYTLDAPTDTTAPILTAGVANRTSDSNATVKFTTDEAGQYYYSIVTDEEPAPTVNTTGIGVSCTTAETTISLSSLTAGAKDIYIKVKDSAGNVSDVLKVDIPAYVSANITADMAMSESNLNGRYIDLNLSGNTFIDNNLLTSNFVLNNAPQGLTMESVEHISSTQCRVHLAFDGTDFDSNVSLGLTIKAAELTGNADLTASNTLTITANNDAESITLSQTGSLIEGQENGKVINVLLDGGTLANPINPDNWSVSNLPPEVVKGNVTRIDATHVQITLKNNATDYDTNITNTTVTCTTAEYRDSSGGGSLSANTGITFTANTTPTVSTTDPAGSITAVSAAISCNLSSNGGLPITARGVEYKKSIDTTYTVRSEGGTATGAFSVSLTGLLPNTSYDVRAYATNSEGTSYGSVVTFSTPNTPPTISDIGNQTTDEDTPIGPISITVGDSETAIGELTLEAASDNPALLTGSSYVFGGSGAERTLTITPAANQSGTATVTVTVKDGTGGTAQDTFILTVNPVNDAPAAISLTNTTVAENASIGTVVGSLSTSDADAGDTASYALAAGEGDDDNSRFSIEGSSLKTAESFNYEAKNSYSIRVRVTDAGGLSYEKDFTISITNINEAPTAISLTKNAIAENSVIGTIIGNLSASDEDAGDIESYALVAGEGATDNSKFSIAGSSLKTAESFNYEAKSSYSIRVRITDAGCLSYEQSITITVENVNEAPTAISLTKNTVAENSGIGTVVGSLSTSDEDAGDTVSYALVAGEGDADNSKFSIEGNSLKTAESFNYEAKNSYSIRIRVTDAGTLSYEKSFAITVENVNEAPTSISLTNNKVAENSAIVTVVGNLSNSGGDAGDTAVYTLVTGEGDVDNSKFSIDGNSLKTAESFNYEAKNSCSIRIRVTDANGLTYEQSFTVVVTNINEAPTNISLANNTVAENASIGTVVGTLSRSDVDAGDTASYALVTGEGATDNSKFSIEGSSLKTGESFNYEAKNSYSVRVRVTDSGSLSYEKSFTITITNINEAPIAENASLAAIEDTEKSGILVATDVDAGTNLTFIKVSNPSHGKVIVNSDGSYIYTPESNYNGKDSFSFKAYDGNSYSNIATVTIGIQAVNDIPVINNAVIYGIEDTEYKFNLKDFRGNFVDVDNDSLAKIQLTELSPNIDLLLNGNKVQLNEEVAAENLKQMTLLPINNWNGKSAFKWKGSDGKEYSQEAIMEVNIIPVNDIPVVNKITKSGKEDNILSFSTTEFTQAFVDVDESDALEKIKITSLPLNGMLKLNGIEVKKNSEILQSEIDKLTFKPNENWNGSTTFLWKASDGDAYSISGAEVEMNIIPENDPPVLCDGSKTGDKNSELIFTLEDFTRNYIDIENSPLTKIKILNLPEHGVLKLNGQLFKVNDEISKENISKISFIPDLNWNGDTAFSWNGSDGTAYSTVAAKMVIRIAPDNDSPIVTNEKANGNENVPVSFAEEDFSTNYSDRENDDMTKIKIIVLPSDGTLKLKQTPSVSQSISGLRMPSILQTIDENDETLVTLNEEISVQDLQNLYFEPSSDWNGDTFFAWKACDGNSYSKTAAVVGISISAVNNAPIVNDAVKSGIEDTDLSINEGIFTGNYVDAENDEMSEVKIITLPLHGTLKLNGSEVAINQVINRADLSNLSFTPDANWNGSTTLRWKASDGIQYSDNIAAVTINILGVNDTPKVYDALKDGVEFNAADFTGNYVDADNDPLKKIQITSLPANGKLKLNGSDLTLNYEIPAEALDSIKFEANTGWSGETVFGWKGYDGTVYSVESGIMTIRVEKVNNIPVIGDVVKNGSEDNVLSFIAKDFTDHYNDYDNEPLTKIKIISLPNNGTLKLDQTNVYENQEIAAESIKDLNFVPNENWYGNTTIEWSASDGIVYSEKCNVGINIISANDAPVVVSSTKTGVQDTLLSFSKNDFEDNYNDVDNDPFTKIKITAVPSYGSLKVNSVAVNVNDEVNLADIDNMSFMPETSWNGTTSLRWLAYDGKTYSNEAVMTVNIALVKNNIPTLSSAAITKNLNEDTESIFNITDFTNLFSDIDAGDSLSKIKIISLPLNGLLKLNGIKVSQNDEISKGDILGLSFVPNINWNGTTSFQWKASDGKDYSASTGQVNIEVNAVNDAPVVSNIAKSQIEDNVTVFSEEDFKLNFNDVDNDSLTHIQIVTLPASGTLMLDKAGIVKDSIITSGQLNKITFIPNKDWNGTTSFTWKGNDGTEYSSQASITITITPVNDAPIVKSSAKSGKEDEVLVFSSNDFTNNYTDIENSVLSKIQITTLPGNGLLKLDASLINLNQEIEAKDFDKIKFTPNSNWNKSTLFTWKGYDGTTYSTAQAAVTINIDPVNDIPVLFDFKKKGKEDETLTFTAEDFNNSFSDIDGDKLAGIRVKVLPQNGILKLDNTDIKVNDVILSSQFSNSKFVPKENWYGSTSFVWEGYDGTSYSSNTSEFILNIGAVNDAPVVKDSLISGTEDTKLTFDSKFFTESYEDVENEAFSKTQIVTLPQNGVLKLNGIPVKINQLIETVDLGKLTFDPNANWNGSTSFTWKASDSIDYSNDVTMTISIVGTNDAPVVKDMTKEGCINNPVTFTKENFTNNYNDIDGDSLAKIQIISLSKDGDLKLNGVVVSLNQEIEVTELAKLVLITNHRWTGTTSFTWKASDGKEYSAVAAKVTINIAEMPEDIDFSNKTEPKKEEITVNVTDGKTDSAVSQTKIERTTEADGTKKDEVQYTADKAQQTVDKLKEQGKDTARIVIPDAKDEVSQVEVKIPKNTIDVIDKGDINLQIETENARISIPKESVQDLSKSFTQDLYFRVVPIKQEDKKKEVEERAKQETAVKEEAKDKIISVVGRPMTIETNMTHRPVDIVLPLRDVAIPSEPKAREEFLNKLAVFIEHSDGERVFTKGEIVEYKDGVFGIKFRITKFSTFTIIQMEPSKNSSLAGISINSNDTNLQLRPAFSKNITDYTASVPYSVSSITLKMVTEDSTAKVSVNGEAVSSNQPKDIELKEGENTIIVTVTAEDGSVRTYTIVVTREKQVVENPTGEPAKEPVRLSGQDRFETAVAISKEIYKDGSSSVILANAYVFADALAGVTLGYLENSPILLTDNNFISEATMNEMKRLNCKNVYLLGGTGAVSQGIENKLKADGYNVVRLSGLDRYKTAAEIGNYIRNTTQTDTAFLTYAYSFSDALSSSTFAAKNSYPILFTDTNELNSDTKQALTNWNIKKVIISGGNGVISPAVERELQDMGIEVTRLGGSDRYETAIKIIENFKTAETKTLTLTSGLDFPDALAGSTLAAKENAPIMIFNSSLMSEEAKNYVKNLVKANPPYVLGGEGAVPEEEIRELLSK